MIKFFIKISEINYGWTDITFENGVENITMNVSYVLDGLDSLLEATYKLNTISNESESSFFSEPDEYRIFLKNENNILKIQIFYFKEKSFDTLEHIIHKGKLVFKIETNKKRFTNQVMDLFYYLLNTYGENEYKKV